VAESSPTAAATKVRSASGVVLSVKGVEPFGDDGVVLVEEAPFHRRRDPRVVKAAFSHRPPECDARAVGSSMPATMWRIGSATFTPLPVCAPARGRHRHRQREARFQVLGSHPSLRPVNLAGLIAMRQRVLRPWAS
jgi:hypothetical protein